MERRTGCRVLAITGGIGSGKTVVTRCLEAMGLPVYSCDEEAKRLNAIHPDIRRGLKKLVGEHVYMQDGTLDKKVLAAYLFANPEHARQVNAVVHPCVKSHFKQWAQEQRVPWVVMESAILYESGFEDMADCVIEVYAPEELRVSRAMNRDRVAREAVVMRMSCQLSDEEKASRADYVLYNDDKLPILPQILDILANLLCEIRL